jgi:hypothetical protein
MRIKKSPRLSAWAPDERHSNTISAPAELRGNQAPAGLVEARSHEPDLEARACARELNWEK